MIGAPPYFIVSAWVFLSTCIGECPLETALLPHREMHIPHVAGSSCADALQVSPDDHSHDFIETVARNAGLSVTIFTDLQAAKAYLTEDVT